MNDKLIQIGGKSYKQCEIIMLATEKAQKNALCLTASSKLILLDGKDWETVNNVAGFRPQHLYILSSEEIKEGEYYYDVRRNNIGKRESHSGSLNNYNYYKKIIATTDILLTNYIKVKDGFGSYNKLPRLSDDFLKAFVKAQGKIDKVLVQYEYKGREYVDEQDGIGYDKVVLKVSPDNTITIKSTREVYVSKKALPFVIEALGFDPTKEKEKTSWSREEVVKLMDLAYSEGNSNADMPTEHWEQFHKDKDKFIEENL